MKTRVTVIGLSVLLASTAFAGPANKSAIPDSARWVVHVDVAAVTASDIANGVLNLITDKDSPVPAAKVAKAVEAWKFIGNVHSVTLYGPGPVETDAILVVSAKYDQNDIMKKLKIDPRGKTTAYGNHTIYPFTGKPQSETPRKQYGCFYDSITMVAGASLVRVKAALDVLDGKGKSLARNNPLSEMLVPNKGSLAVVAATDLNKMAAAAIKDKEAPADNPGTIVATKCQDLRLEFGEANGQLSVTANASMLNEEDAKALETMLSGLVVMAMFRTTNDKDVTKLLQSIEIDRKGRNVGLAVRCPIQTILDIIAAEMAARAAAEAKIRMNRAGPDK